jgi:hypothetical protein
LRCCTASAPLTPQLRIEPRCGRLRRWRHRLLLIPILAGGWWWLGASGALPLLLWGWHVRPRRIPVWSCHVDQIRAADFGSWSTTIRCRGAPPLEVFHDEITAAELARLRRDVRAALSARRRAKHVEPV